MDQGFEFRYRSKLTEESLDFVVTNFSGQATNKDLAMAGFCLFGVDLLVVDDVLTSGRHFIK